MILLFFIFLNYYYNIDNYLIIIFLIFQLVFYYKDYKYYYKRFLLERYLDDFSYTKIENNTKDIKDLRKNVYHYFKSDNKYIREKEKIKEYLTKKRA